jgi:hypothetical protein
VKNLRETGKWLIKNAESIYKTGGGPFLTTHFTATTHFDNNLYVHLLNFGGGKVNLPLGKEKVIRVNALDGSPVQYEPTNEGSSIQVQHIPRVNADFVVKVQLQNPVDVQKYKDELIEFEIEKKYSSISLKYDPSPKYPGLGILTLQDNIRGGLNYNSGHWLGFEEDDFDAIIDLGKIIDLNRVEIGFLQNQKSWIFLPKKIDVFASVDRADWNLIYSSQNPPNSSDKIVIKNILKSGLNTTTRYLRILAKNVKECPHWHPGAGGKAWLFIDEIIAD